MAFFIARKPLSRRLVLRGMAAGAAVGVSLPRLGAMLNGNGTAYAAGAALPKRFGVWFWGNGNNPNRWNPKATGVGPAWELSEQLMPFAKVKQNLTVLSGYDCKVGGAVHRTGPAAALSGAPHSRSLNYTAPTIDHVIAKLIGGTTPFRSLQVGVSRATANGGGHTVNYASASGPDAPVAPEYDARVVFQRLFGKAPSGLPAAPGAPAGPDRSQARRKRVLDTIAEDARALRRRLGANDARRLDQHLDGIDQLEKRISMMPAGPDPAPPAAWRPTPPPPTRPCWRTTTAWSPPSRIRPWPTWSPTRRRATSPGSSCFSTAARRRTTT